MPIGRDDGPVYRPSRLDEETEWINVLAVLEGLSLGEQLELLLRFGQWVREYRDTRLEILEFHRETVRRALALPFADRYR